MKKKYDDIKNLFDDVEQSSSEKLAEDVTRQNEMSPTSGSNGDGLEFLEKILGVMRQIENLQERCTDIQKEQKAIQKRLDGYKDMKVGLSPTDKAVLTKLPELIYQQVIQNVGEASDNIKVAITKHAKSTLQSVDEACDMRIKKAKKELGSDKGIFLSWWNFWPLVLMTVISTAYAIYTAFNLCLWDEVWERIWLPFLFIVGFFSYLLLILWLNEREYRIPQ